MDSSEFIPVQEVDPEEARRAYWAMFGMLYRQLCGRTGKGTPPRKAKVHAILKQRAAGLGINGRRIRLGRGVYHPTKGRRSEDREPRVPAHISNMWSGV